MTYEARLAFVVFFFAVWLFVGLLAWAVVAVVRRGRGALVALPLALTGAAAAGIAVPALGWQDALGFAASLCTAAAGGGAGAVGGMALAERMGVAPPPPSEPPRPEREDAQPAACRRRT